MQERYKIGAILKERIRRSGYTQEDFAEKIGIGLSTLKKYMAGKAVYSIDLLEVFADTLNCSYDYLLGKSLTPERELHDMKEATRLTDKALKIISSYAKSYDTDKECSRYIDTVSNIIEGKFIVDSIASYLYFNIEGNNGFKIGSELFDERNIEDAYLLGVIRALLRAKPYLDPENQYFFKEDEN